ncbi:hypothetical protein AABB02_38505 [Streptomyces rimosus]|uniref:hypothetical protein n=1 Tax=Streptomyces rimosus TaxID=1927 RepID=UPI0031DEB6C4
MLERAEDAYGRGLGEGARFPFELTKSGVLESMKGITPEAGTGEFVAIGRRRYR